MNTARFLDTTTVRELLGVPTAVVDHARRIAYELYRAGRLVDAGVVCRGLIACDQHCAWTYSLHAAVLRKLGRSEEALAQVERGLASEPAHPKLRAMRAELTASGAPRQARRTAREPAKPWPHASTPVSPQPGAGATDSEP